ncbi:MAG: hypothetical protein HY856_13615 [Burkholderiales bacterium]|nr:hypothetical protein [Burkholderiales bacterium]
MNVEQTQDDQDFESFFNERVAAKQEAATTPPAPSAPAADAEPKPESEKDQPPKEAPKDEAKPDLERQLAEALHRERSSANRVSHFMRENNQLRTKVQALEQEVEQLKAKAAPASSGAAQDVLAEAPELEAAVRARVEAAIAPLQAALDAANARLAEVDGHQPAAAQAQPQGGDVAFEVAKTHQLLDAAFPTWRSDTQSADFARWLNGQPASVQRAYEDAVGFDDCATVMRLYYAAKGAPKQQPAQTPAQPAAQQPSSQDRLRQAAGIAPRAGSIPNPDAKKDDFEGSFAEFASMRKTQR